MKLLLDQNLTHRLVALLDDIFPGSLHVRQVSMQEESDEEIWNFAKSHDFVIVTQDSDYSDWNKLRGAPPKIIWIRCGNSTVEQIHKAIRNSSALIQIMDQPQSEIEIVEIW
jgi:predicted nuclease of predicted toxin-antitoxin system